MNSVNLIKDRNDMKAITKREDSEEKKPYNIF